MQLSLNDIIKLESLFKLSKYSKILKYAVLRIFKIEFHEHWGFQLKTDVLLCTVMLPDNQVV